MTKEQQAGLSEETLVFIEQQASSFMVFQDRLKHFVVHRHVTSVDDNVVQVIFNS